MPPVTAGRARDVAAAAAIARLARDPALRQRMGRDPNRRFLDGFTESAVTGVVAKLYKSFASALGP
jgi:hypothetical protein